MTSDKEILLNTADVVKNSEAGLVCEGNPETLGRNIKMLLENPELRLKMGKRGQQIAQQQFSWIVIASQMEKVYQKILNHPIGEHYA